jgi:hypothetical protein
VRARARVVYYMSTAYCRLAARRSYYYNFHLLSDRDEILKILKLVLLKKNIKIYLILLVFKKV